jgi:hypothetical protein
MVKILRMLRYISVSLGLILICSIAFGQVKDKPVQRNQSLALGIDLAPFIIKGFEPERTGLIVLGRYGLKDKLFAIGEVGYENIEFSNTKLHPETGRVVYDFNYLSNGSFLRVGLNYNIFKVDEPGNNDNILVGISYGLAYQEHSSSAYTIGNGYWSDYNGSAPTSSVTTHWMELTFGLRTEVFKNFYMGWAIRAKVLLISDNSYNMDPYAIPGFGKVENGRGLGFSYTLEYQIPFGKKIK